MENERKFNFGDRVRLLAKFAGGNDESLKFGRIGTVVGYYSIEDRIVNVSWDDFRGGHNCGGLLSGKSARSGWNYFECNLELIEETEPISLDISSIL